MLKISAQLEQLLPAGLKGLWKKLIFDSGGNFSSTFFIPALKETVYYRFSK
jgi:hypothetical protein